MSFVEVHKRQWIITKSPRLPPISATFTSLPLPGGLYLHCERGLAVTQLPGLIVLGDVLGDPAATRDWHYLTGRFAVLAWPRLSLDAVGSMGVFYFPHQGEVVCASSTALISEVTGLPIVGRPLTPWRGLEWDPPPSGRISGLRTMFCDQALNLETGKVEARPRTLKPRSEAEAAEALAEHFADTMSALGKRYERIFLSLTGGRDSRLLLSALVSAGVAFQAVTNLVRNDAPDDARVAARLCRRYGITHHTIAAAGPDQTAAEAFDRHTGGSEANVGRNLALGDFLRMFRPGDLIIHGMVLEVGRRFFARRLEPVDFRTSRSAADGLAGVYRLDLARAKAALRAWYLWRRAHPISDIDYVDAFYLDQRLGGWMAALRQGRDAFPPDFCSPAGSWTCIDLLMSASPARRAEAAIQMRAMERLLPGVGKAVPINPVSLRTRTRKVLTAVARKTRVRRLARRLLKGT